MRRLIVAVIGPLASFLLIEVIARTALGGDGLMPDSLALLLGYLIPVLLIIGVVAALVIDGRHR